MQVKLTDYINLLMMQDGVEEGQVVVTPGMDARESSRGQEEHAPLSLSMVRDTVRRSIDLRQ